jgi:competence protein ComEC
MAPSQVPVSIPILLLAISLGAARFQANLPDLTDPHQIAAYHQSESQMLVTGLVRSLPEVRDKATYLRVEVERMHPDGDLNPFDVRGLVLVITENTKVFRYGDRVRIRGYLETPPEDETFSYRDYLARQGIHTLMRNAKVTTLERGRGNWLMSQIYQLKSRALDNIYQLWPDPEASLFAGILLGVEYNIPESVRTAFEETGTSHIIAISGFNIAIVAGLFARTFGRWMGPYKGGIAALGGITLYTILVGADAAVVRAAIMGSISLLAGLVGRRQDGVYTLGITAGLMALANPHTLWDVGFQLSFAATLGLILYADPISQAFIGFAARWIPQNTAEKIAGPVGEFLLFTFAAQVTTLPLLAYYFGSVSWIAFLANPAILPVQPAIMVLGGLSLILSLVWLPIGSILAPVAWPFVLFTIRVVEFFSKNTRGSLPIGDFHVTWLVILYLVLMIATFKWDQIRTWLAQEKGRIETALVLPGITMMAVIATLVWRVALSVPDGHLHLTLLDVGTGDAILVRTPTGRSLLINGGPSTSKLSDGLGRRLPPFQRHIDWLVVASPREEQVAALPRIIARFPPSQVLWAGLSSPCREADYLRENLNALQTPIVNAQNGHVLDLGSGAVLRVLRSGPRGAILLLEWDRFQALLPLGVSNGDLEAVQFGADLGQVPVLLLAENGYAPANPTTLIDNLDPWLVLLSVSADDRDGLPDQETLEALHATPLLRTDQNGWVHITTDGLQMWIEAEKTPKSEQLQEVSGAE